MTLTVIRTYGVNSRYRYSLHRDGMFVRKILSDTEARFAIIYPNMTMKLRRGVADISHTEIEDASIHIVTVS